MPVRLLSVAVLPALLLHGALLGGLPSLEPAAPARPAIAPAMRIRAIEPIPTRQVEPEPPPEVAVMAAMQPIPVRAAAIIRTSMPPAATAPAIGPGQVFPTDQSSSLPLASGGRGDADVMADPARPDALAVSTSTTPESGATSAFENADQQQLLARNDAPVAGRAENAAGAAAAEGVTVPIYPTAPAPSQRVRYQLQRGLLSGTGELSWRHDPLSQPGAGFELQLVAKVGGLSIITQISAGGFDKAGLAPIRFTDQRLRGSVRAANFQRQRGVISFSGPTAEYPLVRGAQDRLSWMIQLPAILAANPRLATPGQQVTMYVVGARGDATIWVFRCEAVERVSTDAGPISAVKLVREPGKEHDTLAEVWLDPARHYVPLRARIGNPDDGPMLELLRVQD